ncbi:MAG: HYExAFE family protein [Phycisphaerales bacterium]|nr:HYExAFE family protein [Planctomycetota bacterium]MCH8508096.1 HYExAFE family protein [Phycisphaerales bacterium]
MAQRRHRAERAFEKLLRAGRIPYVAVNEARQSLLPDAGAPGAAGPGLKNFDFIVYGRSSNLLIEVKGRSIPATRSATLGTGRPRLESWVTLDDVAALSRWQALFGPGYEAVFVFVYACPGPPPDGLFGEVVELDGVWHAVRAVPLDDYRDRMKVRSPRWRTVHLSRDDFESVSRPFAGAADPFTTSPLDHAPALEPLGAEPAAVLSPR